MLLIFSVEVEVEFKYDAEQADELSINVGDIIKNVVMSEGGWWEGELNGKKGMFPDNFVKVNQLYNDLESTNYHFGIVWSKSSLSASFVSINLFVLILEYLGCRKNIVLPWVRDSYISRSIHPRPTSCTEHWLYRKSHNFVVKQTSQQHNKKTMPNLKMADVNAKYFSGNTEIIQALVHKSI